jgi:PBSX family phage terminase large subunit
VSSTPTAPERVPYSGRGAAARAWADRSPEVVMEGPAGTGKTRANLQKLDFCARKYPGMRGLICRKTRESMTESVLVTFEQKVLPPDDPIAGGPNRAGRQRYVYPNGSEIIVAGLTANSRDNRARVMSTEYDLIVVPEATELTEEEWEKLISRLRNGVMPYQQIIADVNPDAPTHWLHQRCDKGVARVYFSRHEDNPAVTPAYLEKLSRLTGVRRARYFEGKRQAAEGTVYEYQRGVHQVGRAGLLARGLITADDPLTLNPKAVRSVIAGVDWGYTNPGVISVFPIDGDGRMTLVHETYQSRKLIGWWVERAKEVRSQFGVETFACDPAEPAYIEEFQRAGLNAIEADNDIEAGIQAVQTRLQLAADGRPRLCVYDGALAERDELLVEAKHPLCTEQEFDAYAWPKGVDGKPVKEKPVDVYNHGMDALRYAVMFADGQQRGGADSIKAGGKSILDRLPKGAF